MAKYLFKNGSYTFKNSSSLFVVSIGIPFVSTWDTTKTSTGSSASNQINLPLVSSGSYDFVIDWGDGNTSHITSYNQAEVLHTYASTGIYTLTIDGKCWGWAFKFTGDRGKIKTITKWGTGFRLGNDEGYFYGCSNLSMLTCSDKLDLTGTTTLGSMFWKCYAISTCPSMALWDVSGITSLSSMFRDTSGFNQDISMWDTSSCANFNATFYNASAFNKDISGWNVAKAVDMWSFLNSASSFKKDISALNPVLCNNFGLFLGAMDINATGTTTNYDNLLNSWAAKSLKTAQSFSGGNSKYSAAGKVGRDILTGTKGWTIVDGGLT